MNKTAPLLLAILLLPAMASAEEAKPVVAVFHIENRGSPLSAQDLAALTDFLANKLGEGGFFRIVPQDEIHKRLRDQQKDSHRECYDRSCQIEVGRELAAGFTVSTGIARMGNTCLITAAMYDLHKAATYRTATGKASCNVDALVGELEKVAEKLQGKVQPPPVQPVAPPPQASPAPAPAPPSTPPKARKPEPVHNLFAFQALVANFSHISGRELSTVDQTGVAVGLMYDRSLGSIITLGGGVRMYSDIGLMDLVVRPGLLFQLSRRWLLTTQLQVGYAYGWKLFENDSLQGITSHGFSLRAAGSIQWLLFDWLGITFDVSLGTLYSWASDLDDQTWQFAGEFGFGGIFAW